MARTYHPLCSNFLFTNLFSIEFLYFFIISSLFPYFNLFVSIFIQSNVNIRCFPGILCIATISVGSNLKPTLSFISLSSVAGSLPSSFLTVINLKVFLPGLLLIPVTFSDTIYRHLFNRFDFSFHLFNASAQYGIFLKQVRIVKFDRFQFPT